MKTGVFRSKRRFEHTGLALVCASTFLVAACGGGGDSTPTANTPTPAPAPTTITITGIAATGAAFSGATVTASDATGVLATSAQPVAADGSYSVTVPIAAKAPIILSAARTAADGSSETLVGVLPDTAAPVSNITPITNVVAAMLSPTGEPTKLAAQYKATPSIVTGSTIQSKVAAVQSSLDPVLIAAGVKSVDPLSGAFKADGTGYDRLLDSLSVAILPTGTASNIEIGVRSTASGSSNQPPVVQFVNSATTLPAIPASAAGSLVTTGIGAKIADFIANHNACYSAPLTQRVSTASSDTVAAVGTASDVTSTTCKSIFVSNDPTKYKNNGSLVGRNASGQGSFTGLFSDAAANVRLSGGKFEFTLPNGDMVVSYQTKTPTATSPSTVYLTTRVDTDGKLKAVGNQYLYNGYVRPFMQSRQFLTFNQSGFNYLSTGYTINIDNTGQFGKVEVVTPPLPGYPSGYTFTLLPDPAVSFLKVAGKSSTNFVRLRSAFINPSLTMPVPTKLPSEDSSLVFAFPELSNAEIGAFPAQSAWTFKYYLTGFTTNTPDAVQVYRTVARAMTLPELSTLNFAQPGANLLATIAANTDANGNVPLETTAGVAIDWTVPAGANAPTSSTLFGRYITTGTSTATFTDAVSYLNTARSATINCSTQSSTDTHCAGASNGGFKAGSYANGLNLTFTDGLERTFATQLNAYKLTVAP